MKASNTSIKIIAIAIYSVIAIAIRCSLTMYKPPFLLSITDGLLYAILTGVGPIVGAIFVIVLFKREIDYSTFGLSKAKSLLSALIPVFLFFFYDMYVDNESYSNTLIVVTCLIYSYCEEFGWRGYLQSELMNLPTLGRVSIIAILWFVWHLNFNVDQRNLLFLFILFFGSWGIGQIAISTKSIIACACFHSVINSVCNMELNLIKISLITVCILSWFGIWYYKGAKK